MADTEGSNSALSADDRRILLLHHVGQLNTLQDQIDELNAEKKRLRLLAKSDGFKLGDEVDLAMKITRRDDDEGIAESLARQMTVASYFDLPVDQQLDLFGGMPDTTGERYFEEGARSGYMAKERLSPYADASTENEQWLNGYDAAQKKSQEVLQRIMESKAEPEEDEQLEDEESAPEEEDDGEEATD